MLAMFSTEQRVAGVAHPEHAVEVQLDGGLESARRQLARLAVHATGVVHDHVELVEPLGQGRCGPGLALVVLGEVEP
jgi:hypothetical protein